MEQITLKANLRETRGKIAAKRVRHQGWVPAILYHRGETPVEISVQNREIAKILHDAAGENVLISLTIEGEKKARVRSVIVKEVQHDPVKRSILHVDFNEISMNEKLTVEVELVAVGDAIGVKQDGGILDHPTRFLKIQCLPADIPKHIDVDVSALKVGDSIHLRDLVLSDKIKVLNDADTLLFQVRVLEEEKADAAAAEPQEIEVIREKKDEEAPAGEKAKEEPKKEAAKPDKK